MPIRATRIKPGSGGPPDDLRCRICRTHMPPHLEHELPMEDVELRLQRGAVERVKGWGKSRTVTMWVPGLCPRCGKGGRLVSFRATTIEKQKREKK